MWHDLLVALSLLLVIEGILPFLNPSGFKDALLKISQTEDHIVRYGGLFSMLGGVLVLYLVN